MQKFERSEIVIETEVYRLHKFYECGDDTPIFVVPPHAGRHGNIAQNLIDKCVASNRTTYAFELLPATQKTKNTSIDDLILALRNCQHQIKNIVEIVGLCQGAWLAAGYTSIYPDIVSRYANFAGPINTKTGQDNCIENYMKNPGILDYQKMVVKANGGIQPGYMQWLAFSMVRPAEVYLSRWYNLFNMLMSGDSKGIEKWNKNNSWHDYPIDLHGTWFLDCLENHFSKNRLFDGTWKILGKYVDLRNITCPVHLYAGGGDDITHWQQVFDMGLKVKAKKILFDKAGHTKCFTGEEELEIFKQTFLDA